MVRSSTSTSSGVSGQLGGSQGTYANESAGTSKKVVSKVWRGVNRETNSSEAMGRFLFHHPGGRGPQG